MSSSSLLCRLNDDEGDDRRYISPCNAVPSAGHLYTNGDETDGSGGTSLFRAVISFLQTLNTAEAYSSSLARRGRPSPPLERVDESRDKSSVPDRHCIPSASQETRLGWMGWGRTDEYSLSLLSLVLVSCPVPTSIMDDDSVFVYTAGTGGAEVPDDVVRALIDPSVMSIPPHAFEDCKKLTEVELFEGLVEIGNSSFARCGHSITKIIIPNSLRRINDWAFYYSLRTPIRLHDGIESIGQYTFAHCIFTNFRVPPLITMIPQGMLFNCKSIFSIELRYHLTEIRNQAFFNCYCLRNVAFPPNAVINENIFIEEEGEDDDDMNIFTDLRRLFGNSNGRIISALQHRFDGLPIHRIVYYQSYHQGVLQNLIAAINMRSGQRRTLRSKLDPTGSQQDCLGMTPLHILTCSTVHHLELYRVIIEKYPTNLITEDRWGATPLLYAFWGAAPAEIIQFLLESYQSLYPNHVFNWTMMVETMGRCDTPKESIENLLLVKQMHFPDQTIDWVFLLDKFASPSRVSYESIFTERMQFLVMCGMSERVESLAFTVWRECILNMICAADFKWEKDNFHIIQGIQARVAHFEDEYPKLKIITTILELTLWKLRINEEQDKKGKACGLSIQRQSRITCGAGVIIRHVLPYLISNGDDVPGSSLL